MFTFSWRLREAQWFIDDSFEQIEKLAGRYPEAWQEAMLFYPDGTLLTVPSLDESMSVMQRRMARLRELGVQAVGIDLCGSFGISSDAFAKRLAEEQPDLPPPGELLTREGKQVKELQTGGAALCPSHSSFAEYQRLRFRILAETRPDFIYIEDDFTMGNHGHRCFCPECLRRFQGGRWKSRETLVEALDTGDDPDLRREWLDFVEQRLVEVVEPAREGVDSVNPEIPVDIMIINASHNTYSGRYLSRAVKAGRSKRIRPGHGWYQDADTSGFLPKIVGVSRRNTEVAESKLDSQYEYETWPSGRVDKGDASLRHEVTGAIMAGCSGFSVNESAWKGFPDEIFEQRMRCLAQHKPAWDRLLEHSKDLAPRGFYVPAEPDLLRRASMEEAGNGWFAHDKVLASAHNTTLSWLNHGFAHSPVEAGSSGVLLPWHLAECARDEDIERWLSGGVICDGQAARVLTERGFGDLIGVDVLPYQPNTVDRFLANDFTLSEDVGQIRWHLAVEANALQPTAEGVETLSEVLDPNGIRLGAGITCYENKRGGRVAVIGYDAWQHTVGMPAHWRRLHRIADWVSRGQLPVGLDACRRIAPFVRISDDGRSFALTLFNLSLDPTGPLRIRLNVQAKEISRIAGNGSPTPQPYQSVDNGIELDFEAGLPAWSQGVLIGS